MKQMENFYGKFAWIFCTFLFYYLLCDYYDHKIIAQAPAITSVFQARRRKGRKSKFTYMLSPFKERFPLNGAPLVAQQVKNLPAVQETQIRSLGWDAPLEKEIATHSSILAWKMSWTEEPGELQSMGSQRVGQD